MNRKKATVHGRFPSDLNPFLAVKVGSEPTILVRMVNYG